jgi:Helix-turn-helix domain
MRRGNRRFDGSDDGPLSASTRRPACAATAFGIALRAARERRRMSAKQLADAGGFDRTYLSLIDHGAREPTLADLRVSNLLESRPQCCGETLRSAPAQHLQRRVSPLHAAKPHKGLRSPARRHSVARDRTRVSMGFSANPPTDFLAPARQDLLHVTSRPQPTGTLRSNTKP